MKLLLVSLGLLFVIGCTSNPKFNSPAPDAGKTILQVKNIHAMLNPIDKVILLEGVDCSNIYFLRYEYQMATHYIIKVGCKN